MRTRLIAVLVSALGATVALGAGPASAATLPTGFEERTAFSGLTNPMNVEFASDGRVFVAEKSGIIKVYDGLADATPTTFADLRTNVHNFWDRGLLGMALAPNFPTDPSVYVLYTHDAAIGGTAPRWGTAGATSDGCPTPPGPTSDGCVVSGRLSRLTASGNVMTGSEQVLIEDWCQQYPSHSLGDLAFAPDGSLYVSAGDGASFTFMDYGQDGSPVNPCGDPPGGAGGSITPPLAEGGALRSQDVRTLGTSAPGGTFNLRPNTDVKLEWGVENASTAWDALDDPVTTADDVEFGQYIYGSEVGKVTEVGFGTVALSGAQPAASKAWLYFNAGANQDVRVDVIWGGALRATKTLSGGAAGTEFAWQSVDFTPPDQAAIDDVRIRVTGTRRGTYYANILAAYIELKTTGAVTGDPTGLDGALLRVNPQTGAGVPGNPYASSSDPNARRIVAFGMRNPFRFALRPGTNEVWIGDVGWSTWEEINRVNDPGGTAENFGWPCYEGAGRQDGYDSADLNLCESLYSGGGAASPHFAWNHSSKVVPTEGCPTGSSSASGAAFYQGGPYPDSYDGAFFFADYSRNCIWAMLPQGGQPSPSSLVTLVDGATGPVDLEMGPGGELYYVDFNGGAIRKVIYSASGNRPPQAMAEAAPDSGVAPLQVDLRGSNSSDPDPGDTLTYAWDLDGDGAFDDSTAAELTHTYQAGNHVANLKVTDRAGATDTDSVPINAGVPANTPPVPKITSPAVGTTWQVGQVLSFAGSATDAQDGTLGASRLTWQLNLDHCPSNCHTHAIQSYPGIASGSLTAPDHEWPSSLSLHLTATDAGGLSATTSIKLDPRTYNLTLQSSNPTGLNLSLNGTSAVSRFTRTVIRNSRNTLSAPTPQVKGSSTYRFSRWSDNGAQTHDITATASRTYTAYYKK